MEKLSVIMAPGMPLANSAIISLESRPRFHGFSFVFFALPPGLLYSVRLLYV